MYGMQSNNHARQDPSLRWLDEAAGPSEKRERGCTEYSRTDRVSYNGDNVRLLTTVQHRRAKNSRIAVAGRLR